MDKSSPRPQSPGAEIYRDRLRKSCQHNFVIVTNFFITLRDQIYRQGFGKSCLGRQKEGWLDCCHGLKRKAVNAVNVVNSAQIWIYPRRSDPFIGNQQQPFPLEVFIKAFLYTVGYSFIKQSWHQFVKSLTLWATSFIFTSCHCKEQSTV